MQDSNATEPRRRSSVTRLAPVLVVISVVVFAFYLASRPAPGQRTTTDTSVTVIVSTGEADSGYVYPIALQEGGDPAHEVDHVVKPLLDVEGVTQATLDWSSPKVVLKVDFDSKNVSAEQVASALASAGYLEAPTK